VVYVDATREMATKGLMELAPEDRPRVLRERAGVILDDAVDLALETGAYTRASLAQHLAEVWDVVVAP